MINAPSDRGIQYNGYGHEGTASNIIGAIQNIYEAIPYFVEKITSGKGIMTRYCTDSQGKRYAAVVESQVWNPLGMVEDQKHYVIYKRKWEWNYNRNWTKRERVGINATPDMVREAVLADATVAFVFIDRTIWDVKAEKFWNFAIENGTMGDRPSGRNDGSTFQEIACPKSLLRRLV